MTDRAEKLKSAMSESLARADDGVQGAIKALGFAKPSSDANHADLVINDAIAGLKSAKAAIASYYSYRDRDLRNTVLRQRDAKITN